MSASGVHPNVSSNVNTVIGKALERHLISACGATASSKLYALYDYGFSVQDMRGTTRCMPTIAMASPTNLSSAARLGSGRNDLSCRRDTTRVIKSSPGPSITCFPVPAVPTNAQGHPASAVPAHVRFKFPVYSQASSQHTRWYAKKPHSHPLLRSSSECRRVVPRAASDTASAVPCAAYTPPSSGAGSTVASSQNVVGNASSWGPSGFYFLLCVFFFSCTMRAFVRRSLLLSILLILPNEFV